MTDPANNCNAAVKPYYYPVEAAIRWCGLENHEAEIIAAMGFPHGDPLPPHYPQWRCLRPRTEIILDAINCGELACGRDGAPVNPGEQVAKHKRTVRHSELKAWMAKHHPSDKPTFLFDETERATHSAITAAAYQALQADRDALKAELEKTKARLRTVTDDHDALQDECDSLRARVDRTRAPGERAETTYLNIIGALLSLLLGKSESGARNSVFSTVAAIKSAIEHRYSGKPGLAPRTLDDKFSEAKRSLDTSGN